MSSPRTAYRLNGSHGVSPVRAIILLYEQMVEDLRHAVQAIERSDVETRTLAINHAILILGHLEAHLNLEASGGAARHLQCFYQLLRNKLVEAQCAASNDMLQDQITALLAVRDAWTRVEGATVENSVKE